jgi:hypothetical protein
MVPKSFRDRARARNKVYLFERVAVPLEQTHLPTVQREDVVRVR